MKAFVFPGQGAQFVGMGKDLYENSALAKELFEKANDILGYRITDIMFDGTDEDLRQTKVTQPAVFLHSVISALCMGDDFKPEMTAGHSLGEFSALVAAGALSFEDGLKLVYKRALAMQKAASESGRIYGMIFHQRLYPKYIRIKQMIDNGELGDIKRVCLINSRYLRTSYYHKSGSWRSSFAGEGGGALINQGQHILDMYQYLFGMPQKLFAAIPFGKYNDFIVDDEATIVMEYDNGKTGTFILSTGEACHEERLEIIGTKARILLEDDTLTITKHRDVCEYIKNEEVNSRQNMTFAEETIQFEKASEPYAQLFENFANAVLKGDESYLTVKGSEGINSLMLCASAYYSACKGIKVELPLEASAYKELMDELIKKEEGE